MVRKSRKTDVRDVVRGGGGSDDVMVVRKVAREVVSTMAVEVESWSIIPEPEYPQAVHGTGTPEPLTRTTAHPRVSSSTSYTKNKN